jgi:Mg2+-importing ATPase
VPATSCRRTASSCRPPAAHVDQALLTGEPYPVEKRPGPSGAAELADAFDAVFGGTTVTAGEIAMLVVAAGAGTRLGGIAAALDGAEPPTAFAVGLHGLGILILRLTVFLVLFVLLAHLASQRPFLESFLFAVALAVGLTPELLPMVMTVTLSRGALRMSRRKVIVKRLGAIHDLGAMSVLCTDKTGTLTEARIRLLATTGADGAPSARVRELAMVNAAFATGLRTPLDQAILDGGPDPAAGGWRRLAELPFDFERRRVSVLAERDGRRLLVVKGAAEGVLERCSRIEGADGTVAALDAAGRAALLAGHDARAADGLRQLAVAWAPAGAGRSDCAPTDERDLVFAGFCVFADPAKASAAGAVARLEAAGVRVKILSGDAAPAVQHLVRTLGIPARGLLTGAEVDGLADAALAVRVTEVDVYARLSPDQKVRVIRALRAAGATVGFIGDGINDAPAIRLADAGISVEGASDVARAAADIILLDADLSVVADGVEEGRRTYANIAKYVRMGTSSNFGNMISVAVASLFLPFLPLTPVQVLLNNLIYDLGEIGIPFDRAEADDLAHPHAWNLRDVLHFSMVMGPLSSAFDLATFAVLFFVFDASAELFRTAWFVESMATQILVVFLIRTVGPAWRSRPHRVLVATSMAALAGALLLALSPAGAVFGFVPLPAPLLLTVAGIVVLYLAAAEALKRFAMREAAAAGVRRGQDGAPGRC